MKRNKDSARSIKRSSSFIARERDTSPITDRVSEDGCFWPAKEEASGTRFPKEVTLMSLFKRLDFLSSGDLVKDQQFIDGFAERDRKIQAGQCPNGCGVLEYEGSAGHCCVCGFVHVKIVTGLSDWMTR